MKSGGNTAFPEAYRSSGPATLVLILSFMLTLGPIPKTACETSDTQRVSLEERNRTSLTVGFAAQGFAGQTRLSQTTAPRGWVPQDTSRQGGTLQSSGRQLGSTTREEAVSFSAGPRAEVMIHETFLAGFYLPVVCSIITDPGRPPLVKAAPGDPSVTSGLTGYLRGRRITGTLSYGIPLGVWEQHEVRQKMIRSGSGFHTITAALTIAGIMDPVITSTEFSLSSGFATTEAAREYLSKTKPLSVSVHFRSVEVLNHRFALSFEGGGSMVLSRIKAYPDPVLNTQFEFDGKIEVLRNSPRWNSGIGAGVSISPQTGDEQWYITAEGGYSIGR